MTTTVLLLILGCRLGPTNPNICSFGAERRAMWHNKSFTFRI